MCTLWQQFGRAARLLSLRAVAILFAESKYFDVNIEKAAAKKRKAKSNLENEKPSKNPRRTQRPPESKKTVTLATSARKPTKETAAAAVETVASVAPMVAQVPMDQQLQALYMQRPEVLQNGRAAEKNKTLEPVMEHFINAKTRSHLLCFHKPPRIYFGNLLIGECRCERHRSCGLTIT